MALLSTWVDHDSGDRISVIVLLDCPLKQVTKCVGKVLLSFEYLGENMARWGENEKESAPCEECGCMLGFNSSILSQALEEATRVVKLRGYKTPEFSNKPETSIEVFTNLPPEYVGRDYLILVEVGCRMTKCKGKTTFSCHLAAEGEGLVFSESGLRRGCDICGVVSQLTVTQITQVVKEAKRQLAEATAA